MSEAIISDPILIRAEVESMDLDVEGLVDCVFYAVRERSFVTINDAPGFGSYVVYDKIGRALRERFCGNTWERDDSHNQCAIRNPTKKLRVVPCNFDEFAGNRLVNPTNKSPKGEVSRRKSICNRTAWLPGIPKGDVPLDDGFQTWVLGAFVEDEKPVTAELSLPIAFEGNHFTDFGRRIMLLSGDGYGGVGMRIHDPDHGDKDDAVEVVDIEIRRK